MIWNHSQRWSSVISQQVSKSLSLKSKCLVSENTDTHKTDEFILNHETHVYLKMLTHQIFSELSNLSLKVHFWPQKEQTLKKGKFLLASSFIHILYHSSPDGVAQLPWKWFSCYHLTYCKSVMSCGNRRS